jgi:molecular chaperone DnaK
MLLSNDKFARSILSEAATKRLSKVKQQSVNARELGILIRDMSTQKRVPHYLIPGNTPLPASSTQQFGTVIPNQRRVHLVIVESGTSEDQPYVVLGDCRIDGLPPNLPEGSKIDVTISYDPQAKVHVSAKDHASGKSAHTEILRQENIVAQLTSDPRLGSSDSVVLADKTGPSPFKKVPPSPSSERIPTTLSGDKWEAFFDETPSKAIAVCTQCHRPLDENGTCPQCAAKAQAPAPPAAQRTASNLQTPPPKPATPKPPATRPSVAKPAAKPATEVVKTPTSQPTRKSPASERPKRTPSAAPRDEGEDEFWKYVGE